VTTKGALVLVTVFTSVKSQISKQFCTREIHNYVRDLKWDWGFLMSFLLCFVVLIILTYAICDQYLVCVWCCKIFANICGLTADNKRWHNL